MSLVTAPEPMIVPARSTHGVFSVLLGDLEQHHVAVLRGTVDRRPSAALQAQRFDHRVDVGVFDRRLRLGHRQRADVDLAHLRHDFERGRVFDLPVVGFAGRRDLRTDRRTQFLLIDRLLEAGADQLGHRLAADLRAETLLDDFRRHLARTEAFEANRLAHFRHARLDLAFVRIGRNAHRDLAFEFANVFNRDLHVRPLTLSGKRRRCAIFHNVNL